MAPVQAPVLAPVCVANCMGPVGVANCTRARCQSLGTLTASEPYDTLPSYKLTVPLAMLVHAGHEDRELEARWGKEVATELKYIESLQQPKSRIRIRATQTDLSAVLALPGDGSDDEA